VRRVLPVGAAAVLAPVALLVPTGGGDGPDHATLDTSVVVAVAAPPVLEAVDARAEVVAAQELAALRRCESGGDYRAVSPTGRFRGAYQFARSTWDAVAADAGRPDLVGIDPRWASPADQDALAAHLLRRMPNGGPAHWPECGADL
jgi:hypothetical protein